MQEAQIYENGIDLFESERKMLRRKAFSLNKMMAKILKNRKGHGYHYQEMIEALEGIYGKDNVNKDSVRRGLSNMAGSKDASETMKDKYGRWPLIKLPEKRLNRVTQKHIHPYAWNPKYGDDNPPSHRDLVGKHAGKQMNFHGNLLNQQKEESK